MALAAIQGLDEKLESGTQETENEVETLQLQNKELQAQVKELQTQLLEVRQDIALLAGQAARNLAMNRPGGRSAPGLQPLNEPFHSGRAARAACLAGLPDLPIKGLHFHDLTNAFSLLVQVKFSHTLHT